MAHYEQRGTAWRVTVSLGRGRKISATKDTRHEAEDWAKTQERKKASGEFKGPGGSQLVEEMLEQYLDQVGSKTDSARMNRGRIQAWMKEPIARERLASITIHRMNEWMLERIKTVQGSTVNREMNLWSAAFTYAVKSLKWIPVNPCHGAARPADNPPRKRDLLTQDELTALKISTGYASDPKLATKTARVGACFLFSLETGMRSGEILRLRPKDYHRKERYIHVSATERGGRKSGKSGRTAVVSSRNVPLTSYAIELLDQLLHTMPKDQPVRDGFSRPPYLAGVTDAMRDALWRKARDKSGVDELTFHDAKHEAATKLSRFIDVLALSHALGIKDIKLLRDTYYNNDASRIAELLPKQLSM